jgi:hypothetical protein
MIRRIIREAEAQDYKLSAFVRGVATSPAFQMNVDAPPETSAAPVAH